MTLDIVSTPEITMMTSRSSELRSTRYKCSVHDVWLTLRTVRSSVGVYRFWQCPIMNQRVAGQKANGGRCQTCKPCKTGERSGKR